MKHLFFFVLFLALPFYAKSQSFIEHTVSTGETLQAIASKYGVSISELKNANSSLEDYVFAGMVLKIPSKANSTGNVAVRPLDDLKDIIYLKDGSELVAKIISVEANNVKFEQYDTDEHFSIPKNEIISIKYEDGKVLDFTPRQKNRLSSKKKSPRH